MIPSGQPPSPHLSTPSKSRQIVSQFVCTADYMDTVGTNRCTTSAPQFLYGYQQEFRRPVLGGLTSQENTFWLNESGGPEITSCSIQCISPRIGISSFNKETRFISREQHATHTFVKYQGQNQKPRREDNMYQGDHHSTHRHHHQVPSSLPSSKELVPASVISLGNSAFTW